MQGQVLRRQRLVGQGAQELLLPELLGQVTATNQLRRGTEIIIYRPDAASLQKVMSVLPRAKLVMQPTAPGSERQITVLLGKALGARSSPR